MVLHSSAGKEKYMATNTVPIEIVLQDPNNPIVPDTPGDNPSENTNISVPDTALGTG